MSARGHRIRISKGNRKMGAVPSISLPPIVACGKGIPCGRVCYVVRNMLNGPYGKAIGESYRANLAYVTEDRDGFFRDLARYIQRVRPTFFRFHVSGDFLDSDYFARCCDIALANNGTTRFLAFTKRADLLPRGKDRSRIPNNFSVIQSMWPQWTTGNGRAVAGYRHAWMQDPDSPDSRIPRTALHCPGNCLACGMCFELGLIGRDVVFARH